MRSLSFTSLFVLLAMGLLLTGCTSTKPVRNLQASSSISEVNQRLEGRTAIIEFEDGRYARGIRVEVRPDSIYWQDWRGGTARSAPTRSVVRLSYEPNRRPATLLGAAGGFALLLALDRFVIDGDISPTVEWPVVGTTAVLSRMLFTSSQEDVYVRPLVSDTSDGNKR